MILENNWIFSFAKEIEQKKPKTGSKCSSEKAGNFLLKGSFKRVCWFLEMCLNLFPDSLIFCFLFGVWMNCWLSPLPIKIDFLILSLVNLDIWEVFGNQQASQSTGSELPCMGFMRAITINICEAVHEDNVSESHPESAPFSFCFLFLH